MMFLQVIKKIGIIFLIIISFAAPSMLISFFDYYYGVTFGGIRTFLIYFLFWAPETFFVKLLVKKSPPRESTAKGRRFFYIFFAILFIALPFVLWYLYQRYKLGDSYDVLVGCTIYIPCLLTALFLIYKFCRTFKGFRYFYRNSIYKQIISSCEQTISVYEKSIRTQLSNIENPDIEMRTKEYMSAKSAYFGAVVKSFLEIIYAAKPSFYFTLAGMSELRGENPELSAGELYDLCMFGLKGKHPRASTIHQMNTQQNKLMDEAMLHAAQQKEMPVDEAGRRKELLSKLRNQNTVEEQEAETMAKALSLEDKRTIRILAFIVAACVLVTIILTVMAAII